MPFNNAGGSIGSGVAVLVVGWICHRIAKTWTFQRATKDKQPASWQGALGRPSGRLNAASLAFLISEAPFPFVIIDIREMDPPETFLGANVVKLGSDDVAGTLSQESNWNLFSNGMPPPSPHHALIFIYDTKAKLHAAVAAAHLHSFHNYFTVHAKRPLEPPDKELPMPRMISGDALAHLINIRGASGDAKPPVLVDVRRHDERTLFGSITGSVHVPAEEVAVALQSTTAVFERIAHTTAWTREDMLVFHSRSTCRARWAAAVAGEQGYMNVLVLSGGVNEWHFQPAVFRYMHYDVGDPIPVATSLSVRSIRTDVAAEELRMLGLL